MSIRLTLLLTFIVLLPTLAVGQLTAREIAELRAKLRVPDADKVRTYPGADLPSGKLRVFLAVTAPGDDRKYFRKRLDEWNRDHGARHGHVEEVDSVQDADVVLTQFMSTTSKVVETSNVRLGSPGATPPSSTSIGIGPVKRGVESIDLPVYSYLVVREGPLWTIVYSKVEPIETSRQHSNPTLSLWSAFDSKMRSR